MARKKQPFKKSSRFVHEDPWRVFRIMSEFVEGFDEMSHIGRAVYRLSDGLRSIYAQVELAV